MKSHTHSTQTDTTPIVGNRKKIPFFKPAENNFQPFFGPSAIQPKMKIGDPDDKYEQQADRVADAVVNSPVPALQKKSMEEEEIQMKTESPVLQMKCDGCEEEERLQMKGESHQISGFASPEITRKVQNPGGGARLPQEISSEMSHKMGTDFSDVNIHTGSDAAKMNQSLGARAFTHGRDIYFNSGEYNPASTEGKRLLAHELTHVVQQDSHNTNSIQRDDEVIQMPPAYLWEPDETRYNSDYRQASRIATTYIDSAQTTVSSMLIDFLEAQREVERIMSLEDPQSIWETIVLTTLNVIISAIPGAGPIARRLQAIERSSGGFYAKGLEDGLKQIATQLSAYAIQVDSTAPRMTATPGPLGHIRRVNNIVHIEIDKREELFSKWEEGWENAKNDIFLPPWRYDLYSQVQEMFQPRINRSSGTFQMEFEKMLAEQAIRRTVQARSGILLFGGDTVYSFYRPSLSRESLSTLTNRYGWSVSQIVRWARHWQGGAMPWNHYQIRHGEEL